MDSYPSLLLLLLLLLLPDRTTLWRDNFARFFPWVWGITVVLLTTGFWLIFGRYGGMGNVGAHVHWRLLIGLIMMPIYAHMLFALPAHAPGNRGPGLTAGWPPSRADPRVQRD